MPSQNSSYQKIDGFLKDFENSLITGGSLAKSIKSGFLSSVVLTACAYNLQQKTSVALNLPIAKDCPQNAEAIKSKISELLKGYVEDGIISDFVERFSDPGLLKEAQGLIKEARPVQARPKKKKRRRRIIVDPPQGEAKMSMLDQFVRDQCGFDSQYDIMTAREAAAELFSLCSYFRDLGMDKSEAIRRIHKKQDDVFSHAALENMVNKVYDIALSKKALKTSVNEFLDACNKQHGVAVESEQAAQRAKDQALVVEGIVRKVEEIKAEREEKTVESVANAAVEAAVKAAVKAAVEVAVEVEVEVAAAAVLDQEVNRGCITLVADQKAVVKSLNGLEAYAKSQAKEKSNHLADFSSVQPDNKAQVKANIHMQANGVCTITIPGLPYVRITAKSAQLNGHVGCYQVDMTPDAIMLCVGQLKLHDFELHNLRVTVSGRDDILSQLNPQFEKDVNGLKETVNAVAVIAGMKEGEANVSAEEDAKFVAACELAFSQGAAASAAAESAKEAKAAKAATQVEKAGAPTLRKSWLSRLWGNVCDFFRCLFGYRKGDVQGRVTTENPVRSPLCNKANPCRPDGRVGATTTYLSKQVGALVFEEDGAEAQDAKFVAACDLAFSQAEEAAAASAAAEEDAKIAAEFELAF